MYTRWKTSALRLQCFRIHETKSLGLLAQIKRPCTFNQIVKEQFFSSYLMLSVRILLVKGGQEELRIQKTARGAILGGLKRSEALLASLPARD
jgi:hypothetical protein